MYRIFCESYNNFVNSFSDNNYRLNGRTIRINN